MKLFFSAIILFILAKSQTVISQTIDTTVVVGNHKLHFEIIKGKGTPILFEAGAGNDGTVWSTILKPIAEITGATLITYDRAGFGKSTIDTLEMDESKHGIISSVEDLEAGLKILGYDKEIMLVSHSYGGHLSTLYSVRHSGLVKTIVLIDVTHDFYYMNDYFEKESKKEEKHMPELKKNNLGFYYLALNFPETNNIMGKLTIPQNIPVVDFVSEISFFKEKNKVEYWKECHKKFVESHPNSIGINARGCHHYIWLDNPGLIITIVSKSYAETLEEKQKNEVYQRALNYTTIFLNEGKKKGR
jgi:hypothetical protein